MKKSSVFILLFLVVIVAEVGLLLYNWRHPQPEEFALAEQQYVVAERRVDVLPFPFEIEAAERLQQVVAVAEDEMAGNVLKQVNAVDWSAVNSNLKSVAVQKAELTPETTEEKSVPTPVAVATPTEDKISNSVVVSPESPVIAIVIDDIGLSEPFVRELAKIEKPMTVSFLTYGAANVKQALLLKNAGMEVMLHVPMMPHVPADLAPVTLSPEMDKAEVQRELEKMIKRFDGITLTGVNNHMGSLFTEKAKSMRYVMEILKKHGMFFLDSKTTARSVGKEVATEYGVPYLARDVFLDNENNYNYIMGQLRQTERIAWKHGLVVAIGHPYTQTLRALRDWVKDVEKRGFKLVHISDLLK